MLLYNITTLVSWPVHDSWFQWTQQQYIPQVLKTAHFFDWKMLRLLEVNEMINNNTPRQKKAAILPPTDMFLMSNANNFISVIENTPNEIIRSGRNLCFMPSHINANEQIPHRMGNPDLT